MKDAIKIIGAVDIEIVRADGSVEKEHVNNLVVTTGKQHIADQLASSAQSSMSHMAIGTGSTGQTADDTALETEVPTTGRKAFDSKTQGSGADANKIVYVTSWPSGEGTGLITEAGIFNAAAAGTMLCRTTFGVKDKGAGDSLTLTWTITIAAGTV